MKRFGLDLNDSNLLQKIVLNPLKQMKAKVFIFGSRARGDYKPFSDVDILFELPSGINSDSAEIYLIKSAIEESHFSLKVDLVELSELASSYKSQVLKEKIEV